MPIKTKAAQLLINTLAMKGRDLWTQRSNYTAREKLGNYYAEIQYFDNNCIALLSCGIFVAMIDKSTGTLYNLLRFSYHYTPTRAKHVAEFRAKFRDYIVKEYCYYRV